MEIKLSRAYSFRQTGLRDHQEDARFPDSNESDSTQRFFVVCDGVGGSEKGEVASQTVCTAIGKALKNENFHDTFTNEDFLLVLDAAYDALDATANSENREMATTLTFVCFHGGGVTMAHIGDSRIYHIRPSEGILYRSDDHSMINSMVHHGVISPEKAINHPQSNVITRYMEPVEADQPRCMATVMQTTDVKAGDYFLLCTDGVLHCISDDQLQQLLIGADNDEEKIQTLATMCKDSEDNNTAWLIRVASVTNQEDELDDEPVGAEQTVTKRLTTKTRQLAEVESVQSRSNGKVFSVIAVILIILIILVILISIYKYGKDFL